MKRHQHRILTSLACAALMIAMVSPQATAADETIRIEGLDPLTPPLVTVRRLNVVGTRYAD
ncbi:MAG: hypothetical protein CVV27_21530, partial [Candidatus Melainabacteria bacterium HGW-Melainabacteria-1]